MTLICLILLTSLLPQLGNGAFANMGIVNGTEANPHSRPYMVSLQQHGRHCCGGFLVSEHFVMTAAHCWEIGMNLTVVLGAHNLSAIRSASVHMVKAYHAHPKYDSTNMRNDIMLLQLVKPVKKNSKINLISIPKKNRDVKAGQLCSIAGWGKKTENSKTTSDRLMEVNVTMQKSKTCAKPWGKFYSKSSMLCTSGPGGFCRGDSGGPLVCKMTAVGIISFYEYTDCHSVRKPYVYTKISAFLSWIKKIMKKY